MTKRPASRCLAAQQIVFAFLAPVVVSWLPQPLQQQPPRTFLTTPRGCRCTGRTGMPHRGTMLLRLGLGLVPAGTGNGDDEEDERLQRTYDALGLTPTVSAAATAAAAAYFDPTQVRILVAVFRDYYRAQLISEAVRALQTDFGVQSVIQAHCLRAALWQMYRDEEEQEEQAQQHLVPVEAPTTTTLRTIALIEEATPPRAVQPAKRTVLMSDLLSVKDMMNATLPENVIVPPNQPPRTTLLYKQVALTRTVPRRRTYSDTEIPPSLREELEVQYYQHFLIRATPATPTPLRAATAQTYLRHARLFVQWYLSTTTMTTDQDQRISSLADILDASGDEQSIQCFWDFCAYLRAERGIAKSYEANLWRGLGKLLKYRHRDKKEEKDVLPAMAMVRKWHRLAQQAAKKAPRQSNEEMKWLSWPEYLSVVHQCRAEYESLLDMAMHDGRNSTTMDRKIAIALQRYLVLAIFATVPDRQRTIRELEIGTTLCKVNGIWCIRHTSEQYKTGKTYGERPLLQLGPVTADIDAFWDQWRPSLCSSDDEKLPHNFLFVQVRTGRPLTQDSVYQLVGRTCYQYTGQRTNPHLLRDMIVTHVRQSNQASEQELEALGTTRNQSSSLDLCKNAHKHDTHHSTTNGTQHRRATLVV
jgi:hypothetical protein